MRQPAFTSPGGNIVEQRVEAMLAQLSGVQRLLPEVLVQVVLEEGVEAGIGFFRESRAKTCEQGAKRRFEI